MLRLTTCTATRNSATQGTGPRHLSRSAGVTPSGAPQVLGGFVDTSGEAWTRACFYGFHPWPDLPGHHVGVTAGPLMASVTGLVVRLALLRHGRTLSADDPATVHFGCQVDLRSASGALCVLNSEGMLRSAAMVDATG